MMHTTSEEAACEFADPESGSGRWGPQYLSPSESGPGGVFFRFRYWLIGALLLLYLANLTSTWQVTGDSALYMLLGRNLAQGKGYTLMDLPHAHVPPGFPAMLAVVMKVTPRVLALNLMMMTLGLASLWLAYKALREVTTAEMSLAVVLVVGFSWHMYRLSGQLLSDVPFMFVTCAALYFCLRGLRGGRFMLEIGMVLLVASCWTRIVGFPIAIAAVAGLLLHTRQVSFKRLALNVIMLMAGLGATFHVFQERYDVARRSQLVKTYESHVNRALQKAKPSKDTPEPGPLAPVFHVAGNAFQTGAPLVDVVAGWWVGNRVKQIPEHAVNSGALVFLWLPILVGMGLAIRRRQGFPAIITLGYLGAIWLQFVPIERYLLPVLPIMVYYLFSGVQWLLQQIPRAEDTAAVRYAVPALACLAIIVNVPNDVYRAYHTRSGQKFQWQIMYESLAEVADYLRTDAGPDEIFIGDRTYPLAYMSQVKFLPNSERLIRRRPGWKRKIVNTLGDYQVSYVVTRNSRQPSEYMKLVLQSVQADHLYQQVYKNEHFTVFSRRSDSTLALREHPSRQ